MMARGAPERIAREARTWWDLEARVGADARGYTKVFITLKDGTIVRIAYEYQWERLQARMAGR